MFKRIPDNYLKSINSECVRIPTLYFHKSKIAQDFFWHRLEVAYQMIEKNTSSRDICLDFGCGNGVFLPTLASIFKKVVAIDIETKEAELVIKEYNLTNVELINGDLNILDISENKFDLVVALDVLEHFKNVEIPMNKIRASLKEGGHLVTSLPTENLFTVLTRKISGQPKPFDHYHKGKDVENLAREKKFKQIDKKLLNIFYPMFLLSLWKK